MSSGIRTDRVERCGTPLNEINNMEESYQDDIAEDILNFKQPKPINPEVKDIELLPQKEREELELLEKEIVEFLNSRNKLRR